MKSINFLTGRIASVIHLSFVMLLILSLGCRDKKAAPADKTSNDPKALKVAILVYPGVELLDFSGPTEVFSNARGFQVFTVSTVKGKISSNNASLSINPDYVYSDAPRADILVIPGAPMEVIAKLGSDPALMSYIRKANSETKLTMSVCTGAGILAKAGILDNKKATSHSSAIDTLRVLFPKTQFLTDVRFVEDGKVVTTAGVSAGIDGALHVVEKLKGLKEALFLTAVMEYDKWKPEEGLVVGAMKMGGEHMQTMEMPSGQSPAKAASPNAALKKDLICGMDVSDNRYASIYKGKTYLFCSITCKKLFDQHPDLYVKN